MGRQVESFQPLSPFSILYDAFHILHAHQFHWRDMECHLWNPKYASHVYKVTAAVDMLSNIIWICPLAPGDISRCFDLGWVWTFSYPR